MALLGGCGYSLEGSNPALPLKSQTLAILPIQNQTFQAGLDTSLIVQLRSQLRNNRSIRLVSPAEADLILHIKLTALDTGTEVVTTEGQQSEFKLSLTGKVSLEHQKTGKILWEIRVVAQDTIFYEEKEQATGITSFTLNRGIEELTKVFSQKVYEQIFYNF
ncbi:LPS assembly lipoprotein LptE [Deltaproteobacteria bacterium TL4]